MSSIDRFFIFRDVMKLFTSLYEDVFANMRLFAVNIYLPDYNSAIAIQNKENEVSISLGLGKNSLEFILDISYGNGNDYTPFYYPTCDVATFTIDKITNKMEYIFFEKEFRGGVNKLSKKNASKFLELFTIISEVLEDPINIDKIANSEFNTDFTIHSDETVYFLEKEPHLNAYVDDLVIRKRKDKDVINMFSSISRSSDMFYLSLNVNKNDLGTKIIMYLVKNGEYPKYIDCIDTDKKNFIKLANEYILTKLDDLDELPLVLVVNDLELYTNICKTLAKLEIEVIYDRYYLSYLKYDEHLLNYIYTYLDLDLFYRLEKGISEDINDNNKILNQINNRFRSYLPAANTTDAEVELPSAYELLETISFNDDFEKYLQEAFSKSNGEK